MGEEVYDEDSKGNVSVLNETLDVYNNDTVPPEILFQQNLTVILVYSALFVVAAVGNLTVFISLFRSRHRKSRISLMIRHLAIADLIVTFIMIPIEVSDLKTFPTARLLRHLWTNLPPESRPSKIYTAIFVRQLQRRFSHNAFNWN
jgi:hypothetical protein